jgi:hypothetical protein
MPRDDIQLIGIVLLIAVGLVVLDRIVRIEPFLEAQGQGSWFWSWFNGLSFSPRIQRCGVDMAPCPHPLKCINGFCRSPGKPILYDKNPLPVVP